MAEDCENTPLLADQNKPLDPHDEDDDRPLDSVQLLLLSYARMMEPITFFSIFPFINQMIWKTGNVPKADTGFYSGMIESSFSLSQLLCMTLVSKAAHKYGKRPVLVICITGMAVAQVAFGFSTRIWQMILFRCIAGCFSAYIVTVRTLFHEISTPKTRAKAFSYWSISNSVGNFLGPFIGGILEQSPVNDTTNIGWGFVAKYPYSLPCIVAGALILLCAILFYFKLAETNIDTNAITNDKAPSTLEVIRTKGVRAALFVYTANLSLYLSYTAVVPVFWFMDVQAGGYGFTPFQISVFLALGGLAQALWILFAYPRVERRIGRLGVLRLCFSAWPCFAAMHSVCNLLLRQGERAAFWTVAPLVGLIGNGVTMALTATQLVLLDVAPTPAILDAVNTMAIVIISGTRTVAPGLMSSLYAVCVKEQLIGGQMWWVVMGVLPLAPLVALRWLKWAYK